MYAGHDLHFLYVLGCLSHGNVLHFCHAELVGLLLPANCQRYVQVPTVLHRIWASISDAVNKDPDKEILL